MCGIVGTVGPGQVTEAEVQRMCDAIRHRGPDDWGTFVEGGTGIGMRRLSIIDIEGGHQPFHSPDHRYALVFNPQRGELGVLLAAGDAAAAQTIGVATLLQQGVVELARTIEHELQRTFLMRSRIQPDSLDPFHGSYRNGCR